VALDEILTGAEAAQLLEVSTSHIYYRTRRNEIPTLCTGRKVRFSRRELLASIARLCDSGDMPLQSTRPSDQTETNSSGALAPWIKIGTQLLGGPERCRWWNPGGRCLGVSEGEAIAPGIKGHWATAHPGALAGPGRPARRTADHRSTAAALTDRTRFPGPRSGLRIWTYHVASGKRDGILAHNRLYPLISVALGYTGISHWAYSIY
jgi:excisionase family DNA binding protein